MRKSAVKNDVAASTFKSTKNTKIFEVAKSPVVLKSTQRLLQKGALSIRPVLEAAKRQTGNIYMIGGFY